MSSPVSSPVKAVLWDLDGTLIDSMEFHWLAWRETTAAEGRPVTYGQFLHTFGRTNASFLTEWLGPEARPAGVRARRPGFSTHRFSGRHAG